MTAHPKRNALVVCVFLSCSLMAAYVDPEQRALLKKEYRLKSHIFQDYKYHERTLEIKFVRQDQTVCGARWDIFALDSEKQDIWCAVSHGLSAKLFFNESFSVWRITEVFEDLRSFLLKRHDSVRSIHGLPMITEQDTRAMLESPQEHPWAVAFTAQAMCDKKPGRLSITAVDAKCCLLCDLTFTPPEDMETQQLLVLSAQMDTLQKMFCELSEEVRDSFAKLFKRMDSFEQGFANLDQGLARLEIQQKDTMKGENFL